MKTAEMLKNVQSERDNYQKKAEELETEMKVC